MAEIPLDGGSGSVPTGALQFRGDKPGILGRGDDANALSSASAT
jgi:hypothetical protein